MTGIAEIATAAVAFLAPFLPGLKGLAGAAAGKLAETVVEKSGEAAWKRARTLWEKISSRWGDDPEVSGTSTLVAATPERDDRRAELATALAAKLETDPATAAEIQELLGGAGRVQEIVAGNRAVLDHVVQRMKGPGTQSVRVGDDARVSKLKQISE
jgi:hypothetical protein